MALSLNPEVSQQDRFYRFADALSNSAFRGAAEPHRDFMWSIARGENTTAPPIRIRHSMGRKLEDFLWAELYPLVNDRVIDLLTLAGITGWATYPVEIYDHDEHLVPGYRGLAITGRCASTFIDKEHSELVYEENPRGRFPYYKGLFIPKDSWDGSDFFMAADGRTGHRIATERVRDLFARAKVTNVLMEPVSEVRLKAMDQPKFLAQTPAGPM